MKNDDLLRQIRETPWIRDLLAQFDFDLARVPNGPVEPVSLANGEPLEMIAGDAAGGAFMLAGAGGGERPLVYVGSEGEGGLIAGSLRDAMALVVGVSSIHDALALPISDDGGARLRAHLIDADEYVRELWPDLDADRARLREALDLPLPEDHLLLALHTAAADEDYRPANEEGDRYDSMLESRRTVSVLVELHRCYSAGQRHNCANRVSAVGGGRSAKTNPSLLPAIGGLKIGRTVSSTIIISLIMASHGPCLVRTS